ncbi:MAG TPA: heavy metal translocating P-type ATPase [Desulfobacterales bacterium]
MNQTDTRCDLCGLSLRPKFYALDGREGDYRFCCMGCRQVFSMLLEATGSADPEAFRRSELFRQCRELGIIPASEADLDQTVADGTPAPVSPEAAPETEAPNILAFQLEVRDMWCPACAWVIDETLKRTPGVIASTCNFSTDALRVQYDPVTTSPARLRAAVAALGYRVRDPQLPGALQTRNEWIQFGVCALLTMNVMMLSFALYSGFFSDISAEFVTYLSWPIFLLATAVMVYGGGPMIRKTVRGLAAAAVGMETLIAVGATSAYFYSVYNFLRQDIHLYFDTASMLITLVLLGKLLERRAKDRVLEDLQNFFSLQPTKVRLRAEGFPRGRFVDVRQLAVDDVFLLQSDEIAPADGFVEEGSAVVEESALTGEPTPRNRRPGDFLRSGTRLLSGRLGVRATHTGADSTLGQMIGIMEQSLVQKTRFEGRTDRFLTLFVPIVVLLAAATAGACVAAGIPAEQALIRAVTVLVISCPCALGVAIPLARVAGIAAAGRIGILVRNFSAFERAEHLDTFVFDKTGTITSGRWDLQQVISLADLDENRILSMAAALEADSEHLIAAEIRRRAAERRIPFAPAESVRVHPDGIRGRIGKNDAAIGSRRFLESVFPAGFAAALPPEVAGRSRVYFAVDGLPAAVLVFGDPVRNGARRTIDRLRFEGRRTVLVSGDASAATESVGRLLQFDAFVGGLLPEEKASFLRSLGQQGRRTAMIGDGVNDAPAMACADLAVAVHSGSRLGREVADITLMQGRPRQLLDFLSLSAQTNGKIRQNLVFSLAYNLVSIPLAMSGLLNPLIAVCAMLLSSLSVIGNTLRLVRSYRGGAASEDSPSQAVYQSSQPL